LPYPNKTALVRNTGMIVNFKGRVSYLAKYAAIFECRNDKGNEVLRKLENPAHTEWDWHNWKDEHGHCVENGRTAHNELLSCIDGGLAGLLYHPVAQSTNIPELVKYIGMPTKEGGFSNIGDAENQTKEAVEEETGIEIGSEDEDIIGTSHVIKPIRVRRFVRARREPRNPPHSTNPIKRILNKLQVLVPDPKAESFGMRELENTVVRYVIGGVTGEGRSYHMIVRTESPNGNTKVRMRLYGRTVDGDDELLSMANVTGERETSIMKITPEYCDFSLDKSGKAYLSIQLKETWVIALETDLRILP